MNVGGVLTGAGVLVTVTGGVLGGVVVVVGGISVVVVGVGTKLTVCGAAVSAPIGSEAIANGKAPAPAGTSIARTGATKVGPVEISGAAPWSGPAPRSGPAPCSGPAAINGPAP